MLALPEPSTFLNLIITFNFYSYSETQMKEDEMEQIEVDNKHLEQQVELQVNRHFPSSLSRAAFPQPFCSRNPFIHFSLVGCMLSRDTTTK